MVTAPVFGQADTETQTDTISAEGALFSSNCPDFEDIEFSGTMKFVSHVTLNSSGGFKAKVRLP